MILELFINCIDFLNNYFSGFLTIFLAAVIAVIYSLYTGIWKKMFKTKCGMAVVAAMGLIVAYLFLNPVITNNHVGTAICRWGCLVAEFCLVSFLLFRTKNKTFIYKWVMWCRKKYGEDTKRENWLRFFLSPYEQTQLILHDAKNNMDKDPYQVYCTLKGQQIDLWSEDDTFDYDRLLAICLYYLGDLRSAKEKAEELHQRRPKDVRVCSVLCTIYQDMGQMQPMKDMAMQAYRFMLGNPDRKDIDYAQVYNNYATTMVLEGRMETAYHIAKEAMEKAFEEKKLLYLTVTNYLKLLLRKNLEQDELENIVEDTLKRYAQVLAESEEVSMEYIDVQRMLYDLGYRKYDFEKLLNAFFWKNMELLHGDKKCLICLNCVDVGCSRGYDVGVYLDELVKVIKEEYDSLSLSAKVNFFCNCLKFLDCYPIHCHENHYELGQSYEELRSYVEDYYEREGFSHLEQLLEDTDNICICQKCGIKEYQISANRWMKRWNHEQIMECYDAIYKEYKAENNVNAMLDILKKEMWQCNTEIQIQSRKPYGFMEKITQAEVFEIRENLLRIMNQIEQLLQQKDPEFKKDDLNIELARSYCIAGDEQRAILALRRFQQEGCPVTALAEDVRGNYNHMCELFDLT